MSNSVIKKCPLSKVFTTSYSFKYHFIHVTGARSSERTSKYQIFRKHWLFAELFHSDYGISSYVGVQFLQPLAGDVLSVAACLVWFRIRRSRGWDDGIGKATEVRGANPQRNLWYERYRRLLQNADSKRRSRTERVRSSLHVHGDDGRGCMYARSTLPVHPGGLFPSALFQRAVQKLPGHLLGAEG